jgi:hypothetical protein
MLGPEYHSKTKLVKHPHASETPEEVWEHLITRWSILKVFIVKTPVLRGTNFSFFHHPFSTGFDSPQSGHPGYRRFVIKASRSGPWFRGESVLHRR